MARTRPSASAFAAVILDPQSTFSHPAQAPFHPISNASLQFNHESRQQPEAAVLVASVALCSPIRRLHRHGIIYHG